MEQIIGLEIEWECTECGNKTTTHIPAIEDGIRITGPYKCACGADKRKVFVAGAKESIFVRKGSE